MELDYNAVGMMASARQEEPSSLLPFDSRGFPLSYLQIKSDIESPDPLRSTSSVVTSPSVGPTISLTNFLLNNITSHVSLLTQPDVHSLHSNLSPPELSMPDKLTTTFGSPSHSMDNDDYFNENVMYSKGDIEALVSIIVPIIFGLIVIVGLFGESSCSSLFVKRQEL